MIGRATASECEFRHCLISCLNDWRGSCRPWRPRHESRRFLERSVSVCGRSSFGPSRRVNLPCLCLGDHGMFGVLRNAVFLKLLLAVQHFLAKRLEVNVEFLGLRQHLVFFFLDVMPHAFGEDGEFRIAMVVRRPH